MGRKRNPLCSRLADAARNGVADLLMAEFPDASMERFGTQSQFHIATPDGPRRFIVSIQEKRNDRN